MIGLDTNVLVRYLAQDDAKQSAKATRLIEKELSADEPGFINLIVVCEVVWVLGSVYGLDERSLDSIVDRLLTARELRVEQPQLVRQALAIKAGTSAGLADILIGLVNDSHGTAETVSFDKRASRLAGWRLLG